MTLTNLFDLSLTARATQPALEFQGETYTFGQLDARSNQIAHWLLAQSYQPGHRLCVYLPNTLEIILVYLACVKTGVIFVPINILYRDREISHILTDADPSAVISDTPLETSLPTLTRAQLNEAAAAHPTQRPQLPTLSGDSPAGIIYTSGTTGPSKGAVLTHSNFAVNAINLLTLWQITAADRFLLALPLFHVHGLGNGIHCWLLSGCYTRLLERFEHQKAAHELTEFNPTLFFGVPTVYVRLLNLPSDTAAEIGKTMRLFVSGSAPLAPQVLADFQTLYGHTILERYGMSETLMNISNPYTGERRPGSIGLPLPGISIKILTPDGQPVPDGQSGELYLKGPNIFAGYWRRPDATQAAFVDGYFRTGDIGFREPDGYFTLSGRKSDLIISGGFNIYPRDIEEFLADQPGVAEAAVTAMPDKLKGEVPVAYIVPTPEYNPETLEAACRQNLASFKVPRQFIAVDRLPRNAMGKIQKHLLSNPENPSGQSLP